jgi:ADP-ribosylglycohydrolase
MNNPASRMRGSLFGGAIGDAFGYEVEFDTLAEIQERFGPEGLRDPVLVNGALLVSDDTQWTLFTAEGIACLAASESST